MSENSIEFSLSNSEQRDSWLNSGHRTLDTNNNLPTAKEIAVIIPEEGVHHAIDNRDVVLWARGGRLE